MKEFLIENYWSVIYCSFSLIALVIAIFRKRGKTDPALEKVYSSIPSFVALAEEKIGKGHGVDKKSLVIRLCVDFYKSLTGVKLEDGKILKSFSSMIEEVLKCPTKKGDL